MGRITDAFKILFGRGNSGSFGLPGTMEFVNGQLVGLPDNQQSYITNGYNVNDVIYSIVNLITDKCKVPDWGVYTVVDDEALNKYKALITKKDITSVEFKAAQSYKTKALKPVQAGKLSELLKYPNDYETFQDLVANSAGFKLLTGNRYIYAELLNEGANSGKPQALHILHSPEVTLIVNRESFPLSVAGYSFNNVSQIFPRSQVLHDKFSNYTYDLNGSHLYGQSPLKAALKRLNRSNYAVTASAAMFQNQGIKGVLYMDDPRVLNGNFSVADTRKQVEEVKEKLTRGEWAGEDNHGRVGFSGYKLGWQSVGLTPVDLAIIESEKWDLKRFCAVYGVPPQLLGDTDSSTYNNLKTAEKALTSRVVIPLLVALRNHLNRKIVDDWGFASKGYFIDFDQTVFTELQEDVTEKSTWVNTLRALSPNEQRSLLGLEKIPEKQFDEPWIKPEDGVPLSEWQIEDDNNRGNDI